MKEATGKNGIFRKVLAAVLGLMMASAILISVPKQAEAATGGTNFCCTVETGSTWWRSPTVKVTNTGNNTMYVQLEYADTMKPVHIHPFRRADYTVAKGKTVTVKLPKNSKVNVMCCGDVYNYQRYYASGYVTMGNDIRNMW